MLDFLIRHAGNQLTLRKRLLLTATLEHFSAVFSKTYVRLSAPLKIESEFARSLFFQHANDELAHCSVVFDLLSSSEKSSSVERLVVLLLCIGFGLIYLGISVLWIMHRKSAGKYLETFSRLARSLISRRLYSQIFAILPEMFSFARKDYHPTKLTVI